MQTPKELSPLDKLILLESSKRWSIIARKEQLPPPGDWNFWMILAGRGFGKSRAAGEWVIKKALDNPGCRIACIAPTAADTRDVMVEGESGIVAISPDGKKPLYEPSKRRITWPNGSIATLYSAEEPNRLRGPQHEFCWMDEICFVVGTKITSKRGIINIEDIVVGDFVLTRDGFKKVSKCGVTNESADVFKVKVSDGRELIGTNNHPIYIEGKGFTPIKYIQRGDTLLVWDMSSLQLNGMVKSGGLTGVTIAAERAFYSIEKCINLCMETFHKTLTCITKMGTSLTTTYQTLSCLVDPSILLNMGRMDVAHLITRPVETTHLNNGVINPRVKCCAPIVINRSIQRAREVNFVQQTADLQTVEKTQKNILLKYARYAIKSLLHIKQICIIALLNALVEIKLNLNAFVLYAERKLNLKTHVHNVAQKIVDTYYVVDVEPMQRKQRVYNLEVEDCHEYFANGILVHNCAWKYPETFDMAMFGLRLGKHPQACITTTPRPTKLLKEIMGKDGCIVVRGSTYDNRDNLAPSFFDTIIKKYEGTRLGRQELNAEILEDIEGALWKRDMIESCRVRHDQIPEFSRIVVAIDPAVTSGEHSAETGIIVVGLGKDDYGYVLDDLSLTASPLEWATTAVTAYKKYRADRVIGEVNNGGDLIETIIRSVDPSISFKAVHATRGKVLRAEPIAALYEQGRIKHVGAFPELEDQLCEWVQGEKSPDRLDALVWALTEIMPMGYDDSYLAMISTR